MNRSDLSRAERLVRLIKLFSRGKQFTTTQLVRAFEGQVSLRLIQRDMNELAAAGIEFIKRKGQGNENIWYIDPQFRTSLRYPVGEPEYYSALFLKDALKLLRGTHLEEAGKNLSQGLDSLLPEKLQDVISGYQNTDIFENIEKGSYDYSKYGNVIRDVIWAILNQRVCSIKYRHGNTGTDSRDTIHPKKILQFEGALYLAAWKPDTESFVPYAIHRILEFQPQEEIFNKSPQFESSHFLKGRFGIFGADKIEDIELKFDQSIVYHLENRTWDQSQVIEYDEQGNMSLKMQVGITPELVSWILGWGKYCTVLRPKDFRENIEDYY